jgi:hypothetical protein
MEHVAQLGVKLGRKGINNRIKQAKDLIREVNSFLRSLGLFGVDIRWL